jgi:Flp pilus assembly protein TadD
MDRLTACLDRGWDLAQKGDASGAVACAKQALELDPKSPEVHNLCGYSVALAGDVDTALEHYRQAIALDETYFEAMLNAAELLAHPLGEWDEAIALCDEAYELAETDEEVLDCLLLKVDALIGKGEVEEATRVMKLLPEGPFQNAGYLFAMGRAYYELGDVEKAAPLVEEAVRLDPQHADALYYLGLVRDERGDAQGATEAFLRARSLDAVRPAPAWAPTPEAFGQMVERAVASLDAVLARYVREIDVYIVDGPGAEVVVDGVDPRLPLLLEGPREDGARGRLFVYQRNVERIAGSLDALEEELAAALEREITAVFLENGGPPPDQRHLN